MKKILGIAGFLMMAFAARAANWETDFGKAKDAAQKEHKYILLSFSGSDWCIPCIKTRKEIFDQTAFETFADSNLVLVNADFPRLRKHELSNTQTKANEALAEKYNKQGAFPLTILMDENGKVLKSWEGYPGVSPQAFVQQIKTFEPHY